MKKHWLCAIAILSVCSAAVAADKNAATKSQADRIRAKARPEAASTEKGKKAMTKEEAEALIAATKFTKVKSKNDIPKVWWEAMNLEGVSDIGGPFSSGCTGTQPHLRLVAASVSEPYALSITEHGGFAYFHRLQIFKRDNGKVETVYTEQMQEPRVLEIIKKLAP